MNIEQLKKDLDSIEAKINELRKNIDVAEKENDEMPEDGTIYYSFCSLFKVEQDIVNGTIDKEYFDIGNFFLNEDVAVQTAEWIKASLRLFKAYRKYEIGNKEGTIYSPVFDETNKRITFSTMVFSFLNTFSFYNIPDCEKFNAENEKDLEIFLGVIL